MRHAVVIDAVRTPIGKASSDKGIYRDVRAEELSAHVIDAVDEADGNRSAPGRRRSLGLRAAAGGAGVSTWRGPLRSWPACQSKRAA